MVVESWESTSACLGEAGATVMWGRLCALQAAVSNVPPRNTALESFANAPLKYHSFAPFRSLGLVSDHALVGVAQYMSKRSKPAPSCSKEVSLATQQGTVSRRVSVAIRRNAGAGLIFNCLHSSFLPLLHVRFFHCLTNKICLKVFLETLQSALICLATLT